jgi:hypothetical protein
MFDIQSFSDVPTFGASASKVRPGDSKYANGYIGEERYPCEHHNWFLAGLTANGNQEQDAINDILLELKNILAAKSVSPDTEDHDQVIGVIQDLIDDIIVISGLDEKTTIVDDDILLMNDSAASYVPKKVKHSTIKSDVQNFNALDEKTVPTGNDLVALNDSAASYVPKKLTMTNLLDYISDTISLVFSEKYNIAAKTASWTIADTDNYDMYNLVHGDTTKEIIGTLPTLADNQGVVIRVKNVGNGIGRLYGEGGTELIDGKASQYIFSDGDVLWVVGSSTEWKILKHTMKLETGGFNSNDHTDRHWGNVVVTMDNVAGTFEVGEIIREYSDAGYTAPTGRYGRIITKTATTLTLIFADGTATFTDDYYLQGKNSGATADVNGDSKNTDTYLVHNTGFYCKDFVIEMWVTTATAFSQASAKLIFEFCLSWDGSSAITIGWSALEVDTTKFKMQGAADYMGYIKDDGHWQPLTTADYSYNIYLKRSI